MPAGWRRGLERRTRILVGLPPPTQVRSAEGVQDRSASPGTAVIQLEVPPTPRFLRLVRMTTAAAGALVIDDVPQLDGLRLAIDELAVTAIRGRPSGPLRVTIVVEDDGLVVEGHAPGTATRPEVSDLAAMLLDQACQSYSVGHEDGDVWFRCRVAC